MNLDLILKERQLKKEVEEIGEKIDQQMKDYRKHLNDLMEEGKKWRDKIMKDGLSSLSPEEKYNFNIWANNTENKTSEILAELKKEYPTELEKQEVGLLENQVLSYNELVIKAKEDFLNNDSNFAGKLYQYCLNDTKDEKYREYGKKMQEYNDFRLQVIEVERQYLAISPDYHLEKLNNSHNA